MIVLLGGPAEGAPAGKQKEQRTSYAAGNAPKAISMGRQKEFQPGALVGSDNSSFVKAYVAMCERGGVSFGEAVEQRYEVLMNRKGSDEEKDDDGAELALIGSPQGASGSPTRRAWFENWAKEKQERKGGRGGDDDDEEGGSAEQVRMMLTSSHLLAPSHAFSCLLAASHAVSRLLAPSHR